MDESSEQTKLSHYYGDIVRILFLSGAVIMMIGLPAIKSYLNIPSFFSVVAILILSLVAGLTNPKQTWEAGLNAIISIIGFLFFESYAVWAYSNYSPTDKFFIASLALGFIFLFAIYFSVKTLRALYINSQNTKRPNPIKDDLDL